MGFDNGPVSDVPARSGGVTGNGIVVDSGKIYKVFSNNFSEANGDVPGH